MDSIYIGESKGPQSLLLKYANRHGLIAGATGTGKTVTLQRLAEGFSSAGVPVFIADVKGDLSGISQPGSDKPAFVERAKQIKFTQNYTGFPSIYWDVFGAKGHPLRGTVSEMGPLLISRMLDLNDTQEGTLDIAFKVADSEKLLLLDLDDLQALLRYLSENAAKYSGQYGHLASSSIDTIQRSLLSLESQGGASLFGEPALDLSDFLRISPDGRGAVNILNAEKLMGAPKLYASFLLWLLSELYEGMPEAGDLDKPKFVFFFDEAHLLFDDAPKALLDKIEQMVRLIRSKGVGVYFVTQNPADIPETVLGQLGNRIQHALRAYTPKDIQGVKAAAQSFRANPDFKTEEAITLLGIGEALVSTLDEKGVPNIVQKTLIAPPASRVGPVTDAERQQAIAQSPLAGKYEAKVNRESATEMLSARLNTPATAPTASPWGTTPSQWGGKAAAIAASPAAVELERAAGKMLMRTAKTTVSSLATTLGRQLARGLLNNMLK